MRKVSFTPRSADLTVRLVFRPGIRIYLATSPDLAMEKDMANDAADLVGQWTGIGPGAPAGFYFDVGGSILSARRMDSSYNKHGIMTFSINFTKAPPSGDAQWDYSAWSGPSGSSVITNVSISADRRQMTFDVSFPTWGGPGNIGYSELQNITFRKH